MRYIDHAIHTSARTYANEGYQIVGASDGISDAESRELAAWCPSHGSLLPDIGPGGAVSFFELSSGAYAITRTEIAGAEYSERGGPRLVTHCLKVSPEALLRFANNPLALINAVAAGGRLDVSSGAASHLDAIPLVGRAMSFDGNTLQKAENALGLPVLFELLDACCAATRVGVAGGPFPANVLAAILNLLPINTRRHVSFAAGLRPAKCRPVQWLSVDGSDSQQCRQLERQGVRIIECRLSERPPASEIMSIDWWRDEATGWPAFVADCISSDDFNRLGAAISDESGPTEIQDLAEYGRTLIKDSSVASAADDPTRSEDEQSLIERLELLDDTIFSAIKGDDAALRRATKKWREVVHHLGNDLVEESREQYLRYASDVWRSSREDGSIGPDQAAAALEIIAMLTQ